MERLAGGYERLLTPALGASASSPGAHRAA